MSDHKHYKHEFTWEEYLAEAQRTPHAENPISRDPEHDEWGGGSHAECIALASQGWEHGAHEAQLVLDAVSPDVSSHIERIDWSHNVEPTGALDVARYLENEPECWLAPHMQIVAAQGRLIHLVVNGGVSAGVSQEQITRRGSAVVALIDVLELAGHSVRVDWVLAGSTIVRGTIETGDVYETIVHIKDWGESLNLGRLIFALAHPGMVRRLGCAVRERGPQEERNKFYPSDGGRMYPIAGILQGDITLRELMLGDTPEDVVKWVREQLEAQGIALKKEG